uniref:Retrovirus-related Pol polyprotein from transposon TNT 1-94 n=1 Tax=Tanacetum cinerariifolium TaxID=118510 RepID=A0A699HHC0_TANCI|nr:retrovirus-related Pol polyprotein from transposon TNT 1-94 [Tanacetum cinerariifolium]
MTAKLALFEASHFTSQSLKTFQSNNKGLVNETFDWNKEDVSNNEDETQVKVLMALSNDELFIGKNHARNGELINITMKKVNILLSMDEDLDWHTYLKYINIDLKYVEEQSFNLLSKYTKIIFELNKCRDDILSFKQAKFEAITFQIQNTKLTNLNHALQDQLNKERKTGLRDSIMIANFQTLTLKESSQAFNECLQITKAPNDPESSKVSGSKP